MLVKGISEQTKRHSFIASLLKIPHVIYAVNKMDLIDYDEEKFNKIKTRFKRNLVQNFVAMIFVLYQFQH